MKGPDRRDRRQRVLDTFFELQQDDVAVQGLTKRYGDVTAIDGVSFPLQAGTVSGFLGPNGAGKSTTLRLLLGRAAPTAGHALIGGRAYRDCAQANRLVGAVQGSERFPSRALRA